VAGLKDSGRDLNYATALLDALTAAGDEAAHFSVLTGTDTLLVSYLLAGARGTICASANLVPETVVATYEAVLAGKLDDALRHEAKLRAVQSALATGTSPAALKSALASLGVIPGRALVPPRRHLTDDEAAGVAARLSTLGIL